VLRLRQSTLDEIERHVLESYPSECCGAVLVGGGRESVRRISNIQDRLHREDPIKHPRDARTAYFMDPKELFELLREADQRHHAIRIFYHSHPEHGAYFSEEDKARAMAWDEPAYPDAAHLVVSVVGGIVKDRLAVVWDPERREFVTAELAIT
jgi:[CysO sulfur-carrier protein]-S-L-cysteine hydrolase